jgi:type II secretory pathway pseudopilin PulG
MQSAPHGRFADGSGFQLLELLIVTALVAIVAAMAVPTMQSSIDSLKLGQATRDVTSELQSARLRAVSAATYMRVRFNCPAVGQFRMVERIGTPYVADTGDDLDANAARRCDPKIYPFRSAGPDINRVTKPNNDGPVRYLPDTLTTFAASQTVEFWPDGSVHVYGNPMWLQAGANVVLTLKRKTGQKTITVTPLGNIQMQR